MIGIVLLTHGDLGQGLLEAVELIAGKQEKVAAVGLKHGDGVEEFEEKCADLIHQMDDGDGVLVFVDFIGGTPSNTALKCMRKKQFPCVAGVNMPMLLEASVTRDECAAPGELQEQCLAVGSQSMVRLESLFKEKVSSDTTANEDF